MPDLFPRGDKNSSDKATTNIYLGMELLAFRLRFYHNTYYPIYVTHMISNSVIFEVRNTLDSHELETSAQYHRKYHANDVEWKISLNITWGRTPVLETQVRV